MLIQTKKIKKKLQLFNNRVLLHPPKIQEAIRSFQKAL